MSVPIDYKDTITLVTVTTGNYGDGIEIADTATVKSLVVMKTGFEHDSNQDSVVSDAYVYVDPTDEFVLDNYDRLEEMYCIIQKYSVPQQRGWFKIIDVEVSDDILLTNTTDNVLLNLKKTSSLYDVS